MESGRLTLTTESNEIIEFGNTEEIVADIKVTDTQFYKQVVLFGDIGFGESFMNNFWESSDVTSVISFFIANMSHLPSLSGAKKSFNPINLLKGINRIQQIFSPNSISGSKKNISKHYDLNNNFFKLFLDPSMTYSSAYFKNSTESLEQAQINKYDRLCKEINLNTEDHLLEIGCGWGGFAVYAASTYGCKVTGITISKEQYDFAIERIQREKLQDKIEIVFEDYRKINGQFDKIISIEMIEAVGHKFFKKYFGKISSLLKPGGALGLQAIIIPDNRYDEYRKSVDWLQKHIFPGGLLPSIAVINKSINETGDLNLFTFHEMGLSYAKTLKKWFDNFKSNFDQITELGFDETFMRKWEFYLCSCEASFLQRNINVVQMVYVRPNITTY